MTKIHLPITRWIRGRIEYEIEDEIGTSILNPSFDHFHDFEMLTTDIIVEQLYIQIGYYYDIIPRTITERSVGAITTD